MNRQLITALLILGFPLSTYALQPQGGYSLPLNKGLAVERDRMENDLGLNPEEKAKVEAIINDESAKFRAIRLEKKAKLQAVLTPEQMAKLDVLHLRQLHKKLGNGGGNNQQ